MRRIVTLSFVSLLATAALASGCERNKDADKQAVEEIVAQRLEAEKAKATGEKNAELVKENAELKIKVQELEKKLAAIQATQAKVAQNNAARRPAAQEAAHQKEVETMREAFSGANAK